MEDYTCLEDLAIDIAYKAHLGQTDKAGKPYIEHLIRVKQYTDTIPLIEAVSIKEGINISIIHAVALLHDSIEDTSMTFEGLMQLGIPYQAVDAIVAMTRSKSEEYSSYVNRVSKHPIASLVKLADLTDNMDPRRPIGEKSKTLMARYSKAYTLLYQTLEERAHG